MSRYRNFGKSVFVTKEMYYFYIANFEPNWYAKNQVKQKLINPISKVTNVLFYIISKFSYISITYNSFLLISELL